MEAKILVNSINLLIIKTSLYKKLKIKFKNKRLKIKIKVRIF